MPHQFGSLLLLAGMIAGPMLVDPPAPDAEQAPAPAKTTENALGLTEPPPASEAVLEIDSALALATPRPTEWMSRLRRCRRRGARRFCDGPRMVAAPHGEASARAETLGLGENRTVSQLMWQPPEDAWVEAIAATETADTTAEVAPVDGILFPVEQGRMGRGFGFVRRSSLRHVRHDGVDIPAEAGSAVRAIDDGIVAYADNGVSGYGNLMVVVHEDGAVSLYAHLRAAYLFAGQRVARGQTLGEVGTTGLSGAPHLHFEYRRGGNVVDPVPHFVDLPTQVSAELEARAARAERAQSRRAQRTRRARRARRAQRRAAARAHRHDHG